MTEVIRDLDKLYQTVYVRRTAKLSPRELVSNLDDILLNKLRSELEDKCIKEGYVRKGSVQLMRRSLGCMDEDQFTGDVHYRFLLSVQVCNPNVGMIVRTMVYQNNKIGILSTFGPLQVLLPREVHSNKDIFANKKRGDFVDVVLLGKKFKLDDKKIMCFGIWKEDTVAVRQMLDGQTVIEEEENTAEEEEEEDDEIVVEGTTQNQMPPVLEDDDDEDDDEENNEEEDDDDDDDDDEEDGIETETETEDADE
jgi:DNA-directed RNA polymerase subunit E'/Rpb7